MNLKLYISIMLLLNASKSFNMDKTPLKCLPPDVRCCQADIRLKNALSKLGNAKKDLHSIPCVIRCFYTKQNLAVEKAQTKADIALINRNKAYKDIITPNA